MNGLVRHTVMLRWLGLALLCFAALAESQLKDDSLVWDKQTKTVDAQIESWDFPTVLSKIASATGWHVYVEPGTQEKVAVRFKHVPVGEAL
jgi:hypothetical protein